MTDFYQGVLHRAPSSGELSSGVSSLAATQAQGGAALLTAAQSLGSTLFNSSEYAGLTTSPAQFVSDLYTGFLQRAPDDNGYAYWLDQLNNHGDTRSNQISSFAACDEFVANVAALALAGSSNSLRYVLSDLQGSARAVMNNNSSSSAIIARHDYLPFGEEIGSGIGSRTGSQGYGAGDTNRWKYGMTERDATSGLDHTWFRKYENLSGRWTSPDPLHGSIGDPQSLNGYNYTGNDPVNFVDPTGLAQCWDVVNKVWFECGDPVEPKDIVHVYTHGDPWRDLPRSMDIELFQLVRGSDEGVGGPGGPVTQPKPTTKPLTNTKPTQPPTQSRRDCLIKAAKKYLGDQAVSALQIYAYWTGLGFIALAAVLTEGDSEVVELMELFHRTEAASRISVGAIPFSIALIREVGQQFKNNKEYNEAVKACARK